MAELISLLVSFPTVIFTIPLGVCLIYWLFVAVGVIGGDLGGEGELHLDAGDAAGAGHAGELGELGEAGAGHPELHHEAPGAELHGAGGGLLQTLGFGSAPLTVIGSLLIFFGWVTSLLGVGLLAPLLGGAGPGWLAGLAVLGLALAASVVGTRLASIPLRKLFHAQGARERRTLLGRVCVIQSGKVDGRSGQAAFADGGAGLILNVTCDRENGLKKGDQALILDYDEKRDVYEVEPVDWLLPGEPGGEPLDPERASRIARARALAR